LQGVKVAADALSLLVGGDGDSNCMPSLTPAAPAPKRVNKQATLSPKGTRGYPVLPAVELLKGPGVMQTMPEVQVTWMRNDLIEVRTVLAQGCGWDMYT
jgi:hypothetical protein